MERPDRGVAPCCQPLACFLAPAGRRHVVAPAGRSAFGWLALGFPVFHGWGCQLPDS